MKKIYNKPTMILVKMETEHFIAASPGKVDQNQSVHEGTTPIRDKIAISCM